MKIAKIYKQCVRRANPFGWVKGMPEAMDMITGSVQYEELENEWIENNPQYLDDSGYLTNEGIDAMSEHCGEQAKNQFERNGVYDCGDFVLQIVSDDTQLQELDRPWS